MKYCCVLIIIIIIVCKICYHKYIITSLWATIYDKTRTPGRPETEDPAHDHHRCCTSRLRGSRLFQRLESYPDDPEEDGLVIHEQNSYGMFRSWYTRRYSFQGEFGSLKYASGDFPVCKKNTKNETKLVKKLSVRENWSTGRGGKSGKSQRFFSRQQVATDYEKYAFQSSWFQLQFE